MNFINNMINGNVQSYLDNINVKCVCIYSITSVNKCNIRLDNKNISYINTHDIGKDVSNIDKYIDEFNDIQLVVSFGGGTAIDIGKYISYKLGIKFVCILSMLSTNTYSTNKVALLVDGIKTTIDSKEPDVILIDNDLLKLSSDINTYGLVDILSIHTATKDWELSVKYNNEVYSEEYYDAIKLLDEIKYFILNDDINNISRIYEYIGRSGELTTRYGSGKPESGSEHIFAKIIEAKLDIPHGLAVIHGILLMSIAQDNFSYDLFNCIKKLDLLNDSIRYGVNKELIKECLDELNIRKDRFTVVNLLDNKDIIYKKYCDIVWGDSNVNS